HADTETAYIRPTLTVNDQIVKRPGGNCPQVRERGKVSGAILEAHPLEHRDHHNFPRRPDTKATRDALDITHLFAFPSRSKPKNHPRHAVHHPEAIAVPSGAVDVSSTSDQRSKT